MSKEIPGLYRLTAELETPLVWARGLNPDGLLMHLLGYGDVITRQTKVLPPPPGIPIPSVSWGGHTVYLSSDALLPKEAQYQRTDHVRRRDSEDIARLTRKFNRAGGVGRDAMVRSRIVVTPRVGWLVWTHHQRWLHRLMRDRVISLGGLRAHGYGRVREWHIEMVPDGGPEEAWIGEGMTLRHLPVDWLRDDVRATALPVRPPYWHHETMTAAAPCGTKVPQGLTLPLMKMLYAPQVLRGPGWND